MPLRNDLYHNTGGGKKRGTWREKPLSSARGTAGLAFREKRTTVVAAYRGTAGHRAHTGHTLERRGRGEKRSPPVCGACTLLSTTQRWRGGEKEVFVRG